MLTIVLFVGMASFGSRTRTACADQEDMPKTWMEARLDKEKEKDVPTPPFGVVMFAR